MADWIEPKTNWAITDYFNAEDYNRIVGNLIVLNNRARTLFGFIPYESMVESKTYADYFYAREMNAIEHNLTTLNEHTYNADIGLEMTYSPNHATPTYVEFNRIESAMQLISLKLDVDLRALPKLPFRLGYSKGVRI